jgi:hypothetical protein
VLTDPSFKFIANHSPDEVVVSGVLRAGALRTED